MSDFRREYTGRLGVKIQVIGSKSQRPRVRPYIRVERNGEYLGSLDGRSMYALRNALNQALAGAEPTESGQKTD